RCRTGGRPAPGSRGAAGSSTRAGSGRRHGSSPLPRPPDLLPRPTLAPFRIGVVVLGLLGTRGRVQLLDLEDVEAGLSQEREELAERQVELGRPVVLPVEPVEPALRPLQRLVPAVER